MKPTLWLRLAAIILVLFAAGHTAGFLSFRPHTAEGLAVWDAMQRVHFAEGGSTFSYGGFYIGFGLFITLFDLYLAWMAFYLGTHWSTMPRQAATLAWSQVALHTAGAALAVRYFSIEPATLSIVLIVCFALAALSISKSVRPASAVG